MATKRKTERISCRVSDAVQQKIVELSLQHPDLGPQRLAPLLEKAGVGVSILSECAVGDELATGTLKKVGINGIRFQRAFYLIVHKHRTQSPLCHAFVTFLKGQRIATEVKRKTLS